MANIDKLKLFVEFGLSESKAKETLKNEAVTERLLKLYALAGSPESMDKSVGILLYHIATKSREQISNRLGFLVDKIMTRRDIKTEAQLNAALDYLLQHATDTTINEKAFDDACGVGVVVTTEEIVGVLKSKVIPSLGASQLNLGAIMRNIKSELPWADMKVAKTEAEKILTALPKQDKTKDSKAKVVATTAKTKAEVNGIDATSPSSSGGDVSVEMFLSPDVGAQRRLAGSALKFHRPGENHTTDGYVVTTHTRRLLAEHLRRTGGRVVTRFPPEPNGVLHIGHAKAINFNFGYAAAHEGGICYLRYDDTNPEKEEQRFIDGIVENVRWLGYTPYKVTHSSDYFQELYDCAVDLTRRGMAYVCHQAAQDLKGIDAPPSPWRDRPIRESLLLLDDMKNGKLDEGAATLRMKITLEDGKRDPVAYRIKYAAHPRTGNRWCVYPTYDFTHCLCDSFEDISHSLCTKEFQARRSSYYWLCNALDLYCPVQWEYGRLNLRYAVVSKRKIERLIKCGAVADWDDPRLFTLSALRRRGIPSAAVNYFCAKVGVTMSQTVLDPALLESCAREVLNATARRVMAVLAPLKVTLEGPAAPKQPIKLDLPDFPAVEGSKQRSVVFSKTLYIDRSDFEENPTDSKYKRLTLNQSVGLKNADVVISVKRVVKDSAGEVVELIADALSATDAEAKAQKKPKAFVQWVSAESAVSVREVRLYGRLFTRPDPEEAPGGFLTCVADDSLEVVRNCLVDERGKGLKANEVVQFERVGFFALDTDSAGDSAMIFNRTVELKQDKLK